MFDDIETVIVRKKDPTTGAKTYWTIRVDYLEPWRPLYRAAQEEADRLGATVVEEIAYD